MSRPAPATPGNHPARTARAARTALAALIIAACLGPAGADRPGVWGDEPGGGADRVAGSGNGPDGAERAPGPAGAERAPGPGRPTAAVAAATLTGGTIRAVVDGGPGRPELLLSWAAGATPAPATPAPATPAPATPTPPSGLPHSVTVVLVQPPGTQRDATRASALATSIRTDVSGFWSRQTHGAITFRVAKAVEWVPVTARCTDVWGLWNEAAAASGFVPGPRRHLVVYVASGSNCSPGLGTIGSGPEAGGYVYLRATKVALLAHELGHNLGLGHSNGLQCDGAADAVWAGRWSRSCTVSDYRDWYDVMGVSWDRLGMLSTAQSYRLGVLPADQVATVSAPALVTLRPVSAGHGVVSLRVSDPTGTTYVVEYHPATGRESWLGSRTLDWRGLEPGVLVRRTDPTRGADLEQTLLLDATPSHPDGYAGDFDEPLTAGRSVTLGAGRLSLLVTAAGPNSATVAVGVDGVWPAAALARLGGRVPGAGSAVDPAPVAVPWTGAQPRPAPRTSP